MKALITGASSGIGLEMAKILSCMGYDLILVARRLERLEKIKGDINTNVEIINLDISTKENCVKLYNKVRNENVGILINNAGFGNIGLFDETDLDNDLAMIDTNIMAVHILTKLFLKDFKKKNKGYILNVASSAAFQPGPLMATYYATKAYVLRLSLAVSEELRRNKSNVYIGSLCPGPVETEFNDVAKCQFNIKGASSKFVANYAIKCMFKRKKVIVPTFKMKVVHVMERFIPTNLILRLAYNMQKAKTKK